VSNVRVVVGFFGAVFAVDDVDVFDFVVDVPDVDGLVVDAAGAVVFVVVEVLGLDSTTVFSASVAVASAANDGEIPRRGVRIRNTIAGRWRNNNNLLVNPGRLTGVSSFQSDGLTLELFSMERLVSSE